ncbi:Cell division and transport-associated protein TolA [Loktanella fryxellensis]|uniref:Cell division and transport-associated protein TolA n=1 Tax=Loktanella fryxellensis TaxID=245187 RepID=A0A1H8G0U0_9RHOB|nr:hypothetical protein [Loktanella fryxellensis]SEN37701.1 Cell division and transport-associated protein TolA [Loktanella fryxellensis]
MDRFGIQWTPGGYVSSGGHVFLLVWLIAGWGFDAEPLPFEVSDVSVVSSEEYAAIVEATTPDPSETPPDAPEVPVAEKAPDVPVQQEAAAVPTPPEAAAQDLPPPEAPEDPVPVIDQSPALPGAAAEEVVAAPNLTASPRPVPRPTQRVTAEAVAPPPEDATPDPVVQDRASEEAAPDAPVVEEAQEQTAPEESATEIVTADETPQGQLLETPRPRTRPNVPTPAPAPEVVAEETAPPETPEVAVDADAVAAALEAAAAAAAPADVPQGPPMTGSEREGFRVAVNACWNVDPGSQAARVTMTVGFTLDQGGRVTNSEVRQVAASGGDDASTQIAFDAARRAILRCQGQNGYDLPADKYSEWQEVEITFDPSGMRLR